MINRILLVVSAILMIAALYMVFIFVPTDVEMGVIQRIFYFHVPLGWVAFLAFFLVFLASIIYLARRNRKWDMFASSSAEIGLVFTTLMLISGSIWAKPVWGVWWTWDPRLTTSLVLWIIFVAYFLVRSYLADADRRARFAAVVGIIGFIDVPIVALAITLTRTQHPSAIIFEGGLVPVMMMTLMVSIIAFTALFVLVLRERLGMKYDDEDLKKLKELVRR